MLIFNDAGLKALSLHIETVNGIFRQMNTVRKFRRVYQRITIKSAEKDLNV